MKAITLYKFSRFFYKNKMIFFAKFIQKINYFLHNSYIPYTAQIGEGSYFAYGGIGVVIHKDAIIGKNCTIGQGVTIGGKTGQNGPPLIGDNVYIATGSKLLGEIIINKNVVIGANSVVIKNIPENSIVAGIPAKVISNDITKFKKDGVI